VKGLIIAYSYSPNRNVGALRPSYWAEEACKIENLEFDVVTATKHEGDSSNYKRFYVPNNSSSFWSFLIKDEGLTWSKDLLSFLKKNGVEDYDFVLFTGGPFFQFSLGKYFKRKGLKVIYDYRDPYSINPRFNDNWIKKSIKSFIEKRFLKHADLVITVNEACHRLIAPKKVLRRAIIANGYDDRIVVSKEPAEFKYDIFYAGRFYWEPSTFFNVLATSEFKLGHAGNLQDFNADYLKSNLFYQLGMLSQTEMYQELNKAEIGVIFTMEVAFESTTKLYDYLALNKKILVITQGEPDTGVLKREFQDYPNYRWVKNNFEDIQNAIIELRAMKSVDIDTSQFSRKQGLYKLAELINQLNE